MMININKIIQYLDILIFTDVYLIHFLTQGVTKPNIVTSSSVVPMLP